MITETIFVFDLIGWFAAHDVVGKQYNFLEPTQPDGRRLIARGSSNPPFTSPKKSVTKLGAYGPRHISTTGVTLHRSPKQADILKKFNGHSMVSE
jgi:hypothetical protein